MESQNKKQKKQASAPVVQAEKRSLRTVSTVQNRSSKKISRSYANIYLPSALS